MNERRKTLNFILSAGGISHLVRNGAGAAELDFVPARLLVHDPATDQARTLHHVRHEVFLDNHFITGEYEDGSRAVVPFSGIREISADTYSPAGRQWVLTLC